jgi:large subunit ribosomal protein L15
MKLKKVKKSKKQRGNTTYGHGARKKWKKSGHRGGHGMAGTGKRADHKKTLIQKKYGNKYFGKRGVTSKPTERKRQKTINLSKIQKNLESLTKKYGTKESLFLKDFKVLGDGELDKKLVIKAKAFSKTAIEKIEKKGGQVILQKIRAPEKQTERKPKEEKKETKKEETKKDKEKKE